MTSLLLQLSSFWCKLGLFDLLLHFFFCGFISLSEVSVLILVGFWFLKCSVFLYFLKFSLKETKKDENQETCWQFFTFRDETDPKWILNNETVDSEFWSRRRVDGDCSRRSCGSSADSPRRRLQLWRVSVVRRRRTETNLKLQSETSLIRFWTLSFCWFDLLFPQIQIEASCLGFSAPQIFCLFPSWCICGWNRWMNEWTESLRRVGHICLTTWICVCVHQSGA